MPPKESASANRLEIGLQFNKENLRKLGLEDGNKNLLLTSYMSSCGLKINNDNLMACKHLINFYISKDLEGSLANFQQKTCFVKVSIFERVLRDLCSNRPTFENALQEFNDFKSDNQITTPLVVCFEGEEIDHDIKFYDDVLDDDLVQHLDLIIMDSEGGQFVISGSRRKISMEIGDDQGDAPEPINWALDEGGRIIVVARRSSVSLIGDDGCRLEDASSAEASSADFGVKASAAKGDNVASIAADVPPAVAAGPLALNPVRSRVRQTLV